MTDELLGQLAEVDSWSTFLETRFALDLDRIVEPEVQRELDRLPSTIRLYGDAVALEYDLERGRPIVRLRLREGQARRLRPEDLPAFDRELRFAVVRGAEPPLEAASIDALLALLRRSSGKIHPHRHRKRKLRGPRPPKRRR